MNALATTVPPKSDSLAINSTCLDSIHADTSSSAQSPAEPAVTGAGKDRGTNTSTSTSTSTSRRSLSLDHLPKLETQVQAHNHKRPEPPRLHRATTDQDVSQPRKSGEESNLRARAHSDAHIHGAPPGGLPSAEARRAKRRPSLFSRNKSVTAADESSSSPSTPSAASGDCRPSFSFSRDARSPGSPAPPTPGTEKPGRSRSIFSSLTRKPWKSLSTSRPASPSLSTRSPQPSAENVHTVPNGDPAHGIPAVPSIPEGLLSPKSTSPHKDPGWGDQPELQQFQQGRKESVSSISSSATDERPRSRGRRATGESNGSAMPNGRSGGEFLNDSTGSTTSRPATLRRGSTKSLRAKNSLERLAASMGMANSEPPDVPPLPPTPTAAALESKGVKMSHSGDCSPKKRDELWNVFRSLDTDLQKFRSKSGNIKANVIRNNVLPLLTRYAHHPSNYSLRPEDLDRRTNILNKWWTALIETLNGGGQTLAVANADRPAYFETLTVIMTRPEFRYPYVPAGRSLHSSSSDNGPSPSLNGGGKSPQVGSPDSGSASQKSAGSDFLTESIYHNVRNIFNQNLLSQLGFCIDRMSLNHCSASLVTLTARTCAYAFFFCPGVADVLVRLWKTSPDGLRRVVTLHDPSFSMKARAQTSEEVASYFPPALRSLSFTSHVALVRSLRERVTPPIAAARINWYGSWVTKWSGRETDLLFVFIKHFHLLLADFAPTASMPKSKLIYIPGLLIIQTQILRLLDDTLSRSSGELPESLSFTTKQQRTPNFDDIIAGGADTTTAAPLGTANSLRAMSENRLLLLLRDVIADHQIGYEVRLHFVEAMSDLLKAVTRKTSLFDHNACFVLLDFVQEYVSVITPYAEQLHRPDLIDWGFWMDVSVQMLQSNNSLTEVRVFAFWFCVWDSVCVFPESKQRLCLGFLLSDPTFYRYFNHWSAMVRAYFHRLLCWRLARYDGQASEVDQKIYTTLQRKLTVIYDFCVSYQNSNPLVTQPSHPAPGRQLLIVRNDPFFGQSSLVCLDHAFSPPPNEAFSSPKNRWKALRNMFSSPANPRPGEVTPPGSRSSDRSGALSPDTSRESISDNAQRPLTSRGRSHGKSQAIPFASFRFSLEWIDRAPWTDQNPSLHRPTVPMPLRIYLQGLQHKGPLGPFSASENAAATLAGIDLNSKAATSPSDGTGNAANQSLVSESPAASGSGSEMRGSKTSAEPSEHGLEEKNGDELENGFKDDDEKAYITTVTFVNNSRPGTPDTPTNETTPGNGEESSTAPTPRLTTQSPCQLQKDKPIIDAEQLLQNFSLSQNKGPFRRAKSRRIPALGPSPGASKYAGRSLSEWALVVDECDMHYEQRREAGILSNSMVEIPTLGVENFRK